jgi:Tn3 transposase DDE domain
LDRFNAPELHAGAWTRGGWLVLDTTLCSKKWPISSLRLPQGFCGGRGSHGIEGPGHTKVINATVRDATHVLDGLLHHQSDLRIEEHYADTSGFTDHVFGLSHFLGFRFALRIRDLADKRLYVAGKPGQWPALAPLIGGSLNLKLIERIRLANTRLASSRDLVGQFRVARAAGVSSAMRLIGKSPNPGSTEPR